MKLSLTIIALALLTSCVTIPIPPSGEHQGKLGALQISVTYVPFNRTKAELSPSTWYAWEHFSKTIKDKR